MGISKRYNLAVTRRNQFWLFLLSTVIAVLGFYQLASSFGLAISEGLRHKSGGAYGPRAVGGELFLIPIAATVLSILLGRSLWVGTVTGRKTSEKPEQVEQVVPPKSDRAGG